MKYVRVLIKGDSIMWSGWHKYVDLGCGSDDPDMDKVKAFADKFVDDLKDDNPDWSIKWKLIEKKNKPTQQ